MKRTGKLRGILVLGAILAVAFSMFQTPQTASAVNPTTISFQGKIVKADGTNVTDGTYPFTFKVYSLASGGTAIWGETQASVTVTSGVFQVNLGTSCSLFVTQTCSTFSNTAIDFNANPALYLGITFNGDAAGEMSPRPQLQSVPYAFNADKVGGLTVSQLVQLSPGTQQTGFVSVNGAGTFGGTLTAASVSTPTLQSAAATALGIDSGTTGAINIGTGANAKNITLGNVTGATGLVVNSGTAGAVFNQLANGTFTVASSGATRTTDLSTIGNVAGQEPTADGINAQQLTWYAKPATGNMSSAQRVDVTNKNTTTAGQVQALRVVAVGAGGAVASDTVGLEIDALTGASTGTTNENALEIGTGWDNLLTYNGTTSIINGLGLIQNAGIDSAITYSNLQKVGALNTGSIASGFGTILTTNNIQGSSLTASATGANALTAAGAPVATATVSLVQLGMALAGGNVLTNGGTYFSINTPASGAGSAADLVNFQAAGVSQFKITAGGDISTQGSFTGGEVNDIKAAETASVIYPEATPAFAYYLSGQNSATTTTFTTTFNITGLPAVDGTLATITGASIKTGGTGVHTTVIQIAGTTLATLAPTTTNSAQNIIRSFIVMRMNGTWRIVGEPPASTAPLGNTTSTATTADYAEYIDYSGNSQPQPGDVLTMGDAPTSVKRSTSPYQTTTLGVVSTTPFQVGGVDDGHSVVLALTGRVPVNVNLQNGPIKIGDKLTASSTPGVAMKANKAGHVIGTALSDYDGSQATAQVIVQLGIGYDNPTSADDQVISSALTSSGALMLDSGSASDVSMSTDSSNSYVNIGTARASGVNISHDGQTTTIAGALVIDQMATFHGPVKFDGASGNDGLLSTANFSVNSAGDVTTSGSFVSKGGGLQLLDAVGAPVFSIDSTGNGTLAGSLNLASATVSGGLSVGGDISVAGLSSFQKLATFLGKTIFRQDVQFDGHITVAADSAGYAVLHKTESKVHVTFKASYDSPPIVSATANDGQFIQTVISNVTAQGFDISVAAPLVQDLKMSWTAVGVNDPQTAANPLVTAATTPNPVLPAATTTP